MSKSKFWFCARFWLPPSNTRIVGLGRGVLADLGKKEGGAVRVKEGRFGVYLNWKRVNAKLPPVYESDPPSIPLEEAWGLIQEKAGSTTATKSRKSSKPKQKGVALPPPPKRPKSAYLFFCEAMRPEVSKKLTSLGDVSKELGQLWKATEGDEAARQKYSDLAAAAKEAYEAEKQTWQQECERIEAGKTSGKKKKKKSGRKGTKKSKRSSVAATSDAAPKRPRSAYLFFCSDKRPEVMKGHKSLGDVTKELARLWAETAGTDQRAPYQAQAEADKVRYAEELSR